MIKAIDGTDRADRVVQRMESFCLSLGDFSSIGSTHDDRQPGLRVTGIRGFKKATVAFVVEANSVVILRIGYLGRAVLDELPALDVDNPIDVAASADD